MERAPLGDGEQSPHNKDQESRIRALAQSMTGIEIELRHLRQHMTDGFALVKDNLADVRRSLSEIIAGLSRLDARLDRADRRIDRQHVRLDRLDDPMSRIESQNRWVIGLLIAIFLSIVGSAIAVVGLLAQRLL